MYKTHVPIQCMELNLIASGCNFGFFVLYIFKCYISKYLYFGNSSNIALRDMFLPLKTDGVVF